MIENSQALEAAVLRVLDDWSTALREKDKDIPEAAYNLKLPDVSEPS